MAKKVQKKKQAAAKKERVKRVLRQSQTRAGSGSSSGTGVTEGTSSDVKGEPFFLPCPELRQVSLDSLPRMTAVLVCNDEDVGVRALGGEDLDALQLELETLLSSVAVRLRQLKSQLSVLEAQPNGVGRRQKGSRAVILAPSLKQTSEAVAVQEKPSVAPLRTPIKKLGSAPVKESSAGFSSPPRKRSKILRKRPDLDAASKPPCHGKQIEKELISSRFWSYMDPYCGEVTEESLNLLNTKLCHNEVDVLPHLEILPLGEHLTKDWEMRDSVENVDAGSSSSPNSAPSSPTTPNSAGAPTVSETIGGVVKRKLRECSVALKRSFRSSVEKAPTPTTSRLMAALLGGGPPPIAPLQESKDSNLIVKTEKEDDEKLCMRSSRPDSVCSSSTLSDISRKHQRKCLERKMCLEKEAQDEIDWSAYECSADSLFEELKQAQADLKLLTKHNSSVIRSLTNVIIEEFKVQNLKQRLKEVDETIIGMYQMRTAAKLAKRRLSQADTEMAWKALKERDKIIRHLDFFERKWVLQC